MGADEEDGDDLDGDDFDDEVKSGEGSATAVEAIHSLFSDHDECKGLEETKAFLSTAKSREDSRLVAKLKAWMESLLKKLGVEMGTYTISAATPDLLQDEVAPFLAQVNDGRPSPWPLVKIVRFVYRLSAKISPYSRIFLGLILIVRFSPMTSSLQISPEPPI